MAQADERGVGCDPLPTCQVVVSRYVELSLVKQPFVCTDHSVKGANIPGRKVEPLNWAGGMIEYTAALHKSMDNDYQGWHIVKA